MELTSDQQRKLHEMLGDVKISWTRFGAFFTAERTAEMEDLVKVGACQRTETIESWGPCVAYVVTDIVKNDIAITQLRAK